MWKWITGLAVMVVIVLGSLTVYGERDDIDDAVDVPAEEKILDRIVNEHRMEATNLIFQALSKAEMAAELQAVLNCPCMALAPLLDEETGEVSGVTIDSSACEETEEVE